MQCVGLPRQQIQTYLFIAFRRIQLCELSGQTLFTFRKRTSGQVLEYAPCRHFQKGDPRNSPSLFLWKRIKQDSRAQRAKNREARRLFTITPERVTTCSSAAIVSDIKTTPSTSTPLPQILIAQVGDQLDTNYTVYELLGPSGLQRMKEC